MVVLRLENKKTFDHKTSVDVTNNISCIHLLYLKLKFSGLFDVVSNLFISFSLDIFSKLLTHDSVPI